MKTDEMLKTIKIMEDSRYKDFEKIRKAKLLMNEHKTMNVPLEQLFHSLRLEHMECVKAWYLWKMSKIKDETERRLLKEAFETELADVANMCYLAYLRLNGYSEVTV